MPAVRADQRVPLPPFESAPQQYRGHEASVYGVAACVEKDIALTGGGDDVAHLWRLSDASSLHVLRGHTDSVVAVALNHSCTLAATASYDATVKVRLGRCCVPTYSGTVVPHAALRANLHCRRVTLIARLALPLALPRPVLSLPPRADLERASRHSAAHAGRAKLGRGVGGLAPQG
jgi:hypothetical protein